MLKTEKYASIEAIEKQLNEEENNEILVITSPLTPHHLSPLTPHPSPPLTPHHDP